MNGTKSGYVVVLDGPDGVGKTTQVNLLADYLRQQGKDIYTTRASGGTPIGEELRKASLSDHSRHPETDLYISLAMHTELGYDLQVRKSRGENVLVDRSPLAIVAYNGYGSQLEKLSDSFDACQKMLDLWQTDVLFLLEARQDVLNQRLQGRYEDDKGSSRNYFEKQGQAFFERVHEGYIAAADFLKDHAKQTRLINIDASGDINTIHKSIVSALEKL